MTVNISFVFNEQFVTYLKSISAKWNPQTKTWTLPKTTTIPTIEAKAKELNIQKLNIQKLNITTTTTTQPTTTAATAVASSKPFEAGVIKMRKSKDGRFVLISMDLIAFADDVAEMLHGQRETVRFKILTPKPTTTAQQQ